MQNFINRTKQIPALIFEANSNGVGRSPRAIRKKLDFKRLSYTSWDEIEAATMQEMPIPKGPFKVKLHPCESQPASSRISWQITPCRKIPGKTRKCKIVQDSRFRGAMKSALSAKIMWIEDKIVIWGSLKDEKKEGEDFELVLTVLPKLNEYYGGRRILLQGHLKRGIRKKERDFVITHEAFIVA